MDLTSSSAQNQPQFNSDPRYPPGSHHPHPQHQHQPQQYTPYPQQPYDYSAYAQHQQQPLPPPAAYHHHHGAGLPDGSTNGHQTYTSPPPPPPQVAPNYHHHQFMPNPNSAGFHQPTMMPPQHPGHYPPSSAPTNGDHQDGNFYSSHISQTNGAPPMQSAYLEPSPVTQIPPNDVYTNGHGHHQHPLQSYSNGIHPPNEPPLMSGHPPPPYAQAPEPHFASGMMPAPEPFPGGGAMAGEAPLSLDYAQLISTWQHLATILQPHSRTNPGPPPSEELAATLPIHFPHQAFKVAMEGLRSLEPGAAERIAKDSPLVAPPRPEREVRQPEQNHSEPEDGEGAGDKDDAAAKKKLKGEDKITADPQQCLTCGARSSPEWRRGPLGPRTLCNACGLVYIKIMKRRANGLPEDDSAAGEDDPQESGYTTSGSR